MKRVKKLSKCKVTVIVPVYNVEKYLKECVDSIIEQTYDNLEIFLIDDGSTDQSGKLCDEYKLKDNRINVIHKKNGGLSEARNVALERCTGDYVTFIDSDDYVSRFFIEVLLEGVKNNECSIAALYGGVDFWDEKSERPNLLDNIDVIEMHKIDSKQALELMLYQKIATGAPFKIYKKEVFEDIRFPVGYYYEDVATTYKTFEKSESVTIIKSPIYAYRKRKDSIIRQKFSEKKLSAIKIFEEMVNDKFIINSNLKNAAISRCFAMMYSVFLQVPPEMKETQKYIWKYLKKCRKNVAFNSTKLMRKKNRYAAFISYLGMNISYHIGKKFGQRGSMN